MTQDVFPEVAVALKRLDNRALVFALRLATRVYLERADRVVAIGERMRERLETKGADGDRVVVIPNWVNVDELEPRAARQRLGARARPRRQVRRHALREHRPRAGPRLADPSCDLPSRSRGPAHRPDRRRREARGAEGSSPACSRSNVVFMGYQAREGLGDSLSSADVHVVGLAQGPRGLRRAEPALRRARGRAGP